MNLDDDNLDQDVNLRTASYDDDIADVDFSIDADGLLALDDDKPVEDKHGDDDKPAEDKDQKFSLRSKALNKKPEEDTTDGKTKEDQSNKEPTDEFTGPPKDSPHRPEWDKLKTAHSETKQLLEQTTAELETFKSGSDGNSTSLKSRIAELEKQNEEYSTRLKAVDFKNHPEFLEKFEKPLQAAKSELSELAQMDEIEVNIDSLMELKGKEFSNRVSDILRDLSDFNGAAFAAKAREAYKLIADREAAAANSDKFVNEANQRNEAAIRETFGKVSKTYGDLVEKVDIPDGISDEEKKNLTELNAAAAGIIARAEQLAFNASSDEEVARMAHDAALTPFLVNHILPRLEAVAEAEIAARDEQITKLTEQLRRFDDSIPSYSSHGTKPQEKGLEDMSLDELVSQVSFGT